MNKLPSQTTVIDLLQYRPLTDEEIDAMERRFNDATFAAEMALVVARFEVEERFGYEAARVADLRAQHCFWAEIQAHEITGDLWNFLLSIRTDFARGMLNEMNHSGCFNFSKAFYSALDEQQHWGAYYYDYDTDWFGDGDDDLESRYILEDVW